MGVVEPQSLSFPKILQRRMTQILLTPQLLHTADQPRLYPLRCRPWSGMLLHPLT